MSNELALIPMAEMKEMANAVCKSGLFAMQTPEAALTLMMICQSEGLHPMQALKRYHIIKGRPSMRADAMLAEFQRQGGSVEWLERTDTICKAIFSHQQGGKVDVTWTIEMAKAANLIVIKDSRGEPGMWLKFPRQMLTARTISEGVRTVLPGVVAGIYTPEEINDFADAEVIKPVKQTKPIEPKTTVTAPPDVVEPIALKIPDGTITTAPTPTQKAQMLVDKIAADRKLPAEFEPNDLPVEPIGEIKAADRPAPKSEVAQKSAAEVAVELKLIRKLAADNGDAKTSDDIQNLVKSILGYTKSSSMMSDAERTQVIEALRCM